MKLQLVQPTTGCYRSNSRTGCYPPLGLMSIATFLKQLHSSVEIEILDGEIISQNEIINRLDADIIGLNTNTVTYPQAITIAEEAKALGAKVVLGGVYASAIPDLILRHQGTIIDSLVVGYGEQPMADIVEGRNDKLILNPIPDFSTTPLIDRNTIYMDRYIDLFNNNHPTWDYRGTSIFTSVGCKWKELSMGGCIFCSRSGRGYFARNPELVWKEVRELVEKYRIEYLVDFSDTSFQDIDWLRALATSRPKDLSPRWHIFGRMDEINIDAINIVKQLPCDHIFIGIESGDPCTYETVRKGGGSPEDSLRMARLLNEYGIEITPSYVIGLPGESLESMVNTYNHARELKKFTKFEEIFCCELIPFPGSRAFGQLRNKISIESDMLDVELLKHLWAENFCSTNVDEMQEYVHKILDLGKYKITISKNIQNSHLHENTNANKHAANYDKQIKASEGTDVYSCV